MAAHAIGERFVVLDATALRAFELPVAAIGATLDLLATGLGDEGVPVTVSVEVAGRSVRPPAPVHLTARREGDTSILFQWVRRSRLGWAWSDNGDAPLGEESERWRVTIVPDVGAPRTVETTSAAYGYSAAEQAADGAVMATSFALSVLQLGSLAASSPPAERIFTL